MLCVRIYMDKGDPPPDRGASEAWLDRSDPAMEHSEGEGGP